METETEQIFKEQLGKLPAEVVDFISTASWEEDLDEIGSLYNLSEKEQSDFKREVTLVVAGIIHPDAFSETLEQEAGIKGAVLEAVIKAVEQKIFASIRPSLVDFLEKEARAGEKGKIEEAFTPKETTTEEHLIRAPDVAPDNLPITEDAEALLPLVPFRLGDEESAEPLMPPIPLKTKSEQSTDVSSHPFEEKMKQVFTASIQPMVVPEGAKAVPLAPVSIGSTIQPLPRVDPYREPIE